MSTEIEPPELARLVDFPERPRVDDWSLRAAMVRCAQPEPQRASRVLALVRRVERALQEHVKLLRSDGTALWEALDGGGLAAPAHERVVELLRVAARLDRLGDLVAAWAADWPADQPDGEIDTIAREVATRLEELDVPPEEPPENLRRNRG